jgi:multidrug efflux system membrane fusion protein
LRAARAQLAEAEASYRQAEADFGRASNLFESRSLTRADYDTVSAKRDASRARVDLAKDQVAAIQSRTEGAKAALGEATLAGEDSALKAPFDAVVLKRMVEAGSLVGAGTAGFVLADTTDVKAVFGVPDTVVPGLRTGARLAVATEAIPATGFSGVITRISPAADPKSRVFEVEVTVSNRKNLLRTGMIASVTLSNGASGKNVPVLPLAAIVRSKARPEGYAVFTVEREGARQIARLRDVVLGEGFGNGIAVRSGVEIGQQVITNGSNVVSDGEPVQVVP